MFDKPRFFSAVCILLISAFLFCGCESKEQTSKNHTDERRTTVHDVLSPAASGANSSGNDIVSIDYSNISEGYVMVKYSGSADKARLQITLPDQTVYSYYLSSGSYETFPLPGGNGAYHLDVMEHAFDDMYAMAYAQDIDVTLNDEFKPFLYPNQYVWFTPDSEAIQLGINLSDESSNDLDYVEQIYNYVISNIQYDEEKAVNISPDYLPDIDQTLDTNKGICFDYASLMAALLRSQGIPTKLVTGYSGTAYHAWISVYLKETGWVDNIIQFDGESWSLMDPTLAASNDSSSVREYVGDGSNYTAKYYY